MAIEVTSRYRFNSFEAIRQYKLDAVLTSDPIFNGVLHYQPLFDFELVLIVAKQHRLAGLKVIEPADLQQETILTYPVERERLDMFRKVLQNLPGLNRSTMSPWKKPTLCCCWPPASAAFACCRNGC